MTGEKMWVKTITGYTYTLEIGNVNKKIFVSVLTIDSYAGNIQLFYS